MNKAEMVNAVADKAGITKAQAAAALDTMIGSIGSALRGGDKVTLVGFGTFSVVQRGARTGRNPRDNKPIKIAAKQVAKFKPGKKLADDRNGKGRKKKKIKPVFLEWPARAIGLSFFYLYFDYPMKTRKPSRDEG